MRHKPEQSVSSTTFGGCDLGSIKFLGKYLERLPCQPPPRHSHTIKILLGGLLTCYNQILSSSSFFPPQLLSAWEGFPQVRDQQHQATTPVPPLDALATITPRLIVDDHISMLPIWKYNNNDDDLVGLMIILLRNDSGRSLQLLPSNQPQQQLQVEFAIQNFVFLAPSGALVFIMVYYISASHFFKFFKFFRF